VAHTGDKVLWDSGLFSIRWDSDDDPPQPLPENRPEGARDVVGQRDYGKGSDPNYYNNGQQRKAYCAVREWLRRRGQTLPAVDPAVQCG
jgi:hypothetical protein